MNTPVGRSFMGSRSYSIMIGIFVLAVVALALPTFSVESSAPATKNTSTDYLAAAKTMRFAVGNWTPVPALVGETVELFAADCATPKTAFTLGETVCAKTDGVDLTVPANHYMNWTDSSLNETNGGTTTQNRQYFLFVPPSADTWKATIGRVTPADSSIIGDPPTFTVSNGPGISTYSATCTTPQTTFTLGQTVCAIAKATGGAAARRRVAWIDPSGNARQVDDITTDPESFSFPIPLTQTSLVGGETVDNRGNWKVNIISSRSSVVATTTFVVTDATAPSADVSAVKFSESSSASAGSNTKFFISVYNNGPDSAANVVLSDPLPTNTTYYSLTQPSGPTFNCTTPNIGSTGAINCTLASLPRNTTAQFELTVQIDSGAPTNSVITNTATVSSDADDNSENDSSSASVTVAGGGGGGETCTVGCPDDIQTPANTVDQTITPARSSLSPPTVSSVWQHHRRSLQRVLLPEEHGRDRTSETGDVCRFTVTLPGRPRSND